VLYSPRKSFRTFPPLILALQQSHDSEDGVTHASAYWRVAQTNFCQSEETGKVNLYAYHNKASSDAGKANVGQRDYPVDGTQYNKYFTPSKVGASGQNHVKRAYELIKKSPDVLKSGYQEIESKFYKDADVTDGVGAKGKDVTEATAKESFFTSAKDV